MIKLIALSIGGQGVNQQTLPTYRLQLPWQIATLTRLRIQDLVSFIILLLLTVAVLLAFFFLIFGGLRWMLSQGDKKKVEEAQKTVTYAIIGLIVVFLSFFILNLIGFAFIQGPLIWKLGS